MCGIAGTLDLRLRQAAEPAVLRRMATAMSHRGPDDEGIHVSGPLGLAFRRLSIIDLDGGHQPMPDERGEVWVVFNGEIYNFRSLRTQLEASGARFRTRCDTEVLVHGWRRWGLELLDRLNGMFGLAIWDERDRQLVLARDHAGIKPLYWTVDDGGRLVFGSEVRAITAASGRRSRPDPLALALFLRYRYTPAPMTLHEGIRKLPAGTCLVVRDGEIEERTWWPFAPTPLDPAPDAELAAAELAARYGAAVERQLVSDVPVGLLLSGGVDSAHLLAQMNRHGGPWKTFTVGFDDFRDDELADAATTAASLGGDHTAVRLDRAAFDKILPAAVRAVEEPVASPSIVPMYAVCERASDDVKVALVGQGPDELFGGYRRHLGVRYGGPWRTLPSPVRGAAAQAVERLPRAETLKRGVRALGEPQMLRRHQDVLALLPEEQITSLLRPGLLRAGLADSLMACWEPFASSLGGTDDLTAFNCVELRSSLPDELLLYGDKLSMQHGLEVRVPYLDREVVEYGLRLPAALKVRRGTGKWVHRRAVEGSVPREVLRRPKRGFAVNVVDDWFRSSVDSVLTDALLDPSSAIFGVVDPRPVAALVDQHRSGRSDVHKILFSLVVAELWMREALS